MFVVVDKVSEMFVICYGIIMYCYVVNVSREGYYERSYDVFFEYIVKFVFWVDLCLESWYFEVVFGFESSNVFFLEIVI